MELKNNVLRFISFNLGKRLNQICLSTSLENDLQLDSIDRLDLIFKLENYYDVQLSADQVEDVATISDLCHHLENQLSNVLKVA